MKNKTKILTLILVILVVAGTVTFLAKPELFQGKTWLNYFSGETYTDNNGKKWIVYNSTSSGKISYCSGYFAYNNPLFQKNSAQVWYPGGKTYQYPEAPKSDICLTKNTVTQFSCSPDIDLYATIIEHNNDCPEEMKCENGRCVDGFNIEDIKLQYKEKKKRTTRPEPMKFKLRTPNDVKLNQPKDNTNLFIK